jgi:PAS domain S-box-containing protein
MAAPILHEQEIFGFLGLLSSTPHFFMPDHAPRLQAFANQAAIALQNAQLYSQIQRHADELEQRVNERTAQLNHAKDRIEAILNSSSDVMILCRPDGRIDQVNPAFDTLFRCKSDEIYLQPLSMLAIPEHTALLEQAFAEVLETRQPKRLALTVYFPQRTSFDADIVLSPIVEQNDRLLSVVCSLRDMTQHKQMEAQLRQMLKQAMELSDLKSRYVSMAAHDLRNPLAVIQSAVNLIQAYSERLTDEKRQAIFDRIQTNIQVMIEMLDSFLTVGQAESGKLTFNPAPLDVIDFCHKLSTQLNQVAGFPLRIVFSDQGGCHDARMDAQLLRHIFSNLLSNALKYSPDDSIVTFTVRCDPEQVIFQVQDQGIGIPEADQPRLFEAFHRAGNVGSTPGIGLGLAIVKQSVDLHGGTITFQSEEGCGTTFTVILPKVPPAELT